MKKLIVIHTIIIFIMLLFLLAGAFSPVYHEVTANDLVLKESPAQPSPPQSYVPDEIIVKFKKGIPSVAMEQMDRAMGTEVARVSPYAGFRVLKIPKGKTVAEMVEAFSELSNVAYAEPNYIHHITWSANDTYYSYQWHFDQINLEAAWDLDTSAPNYGGDSSIVVAVIDSGVAYETYSSYLQAPDLASTNFWTNSGETPGNSTDDDSNGYVDDVNGWDFVNTDAHPNDDNSHGTHVCGTIAQNTNNTIGVAGIAFNTTIMPLKAFDSAGSGDTAQIADAYYYAADNGAHIINYSAGGPDSATLQNAAAYARNAGVIIIAAAGNDYQTGNDPSYPAAYDDYTIAVGATRYDVTRSYYSNTGSYLDIAAPGGDTRPGVDQNGDGYDDGVLQNTFNPDTKDPTDFAYYFLQGTSMATPHVSGVAALILAENPTWSAAQVRHALQSTANDTGTAGKDNEYGWGLLNAPDSVGATLPVLASFSDAGLTTPCDNFTGIASENTTYMYGTGLLPSQNYSAVYYDGGDTRRDTDDVTSGASGNLSSNHAFVQGTDVNGTWHVVICDQAHTPPSTYSSNWTYAITEDTFTLQFDLPPTMEAIAEAEGQYYNTAPILSNFGFDDDNALDDGSYQMDSYNGTWATLFTDWGATSWDSDNWTIPDFAGLNEGSHTIYFMASDNASNVEGESGEWDWQFYKDTGPPDDPTSVNSTSHSLSTWSANNTVTVIWTDATDNTSGLDGYSILWDTSANTTPSANKSVEEGVQIAIGAFLADGNSHYFHIRSVDNVGNWQSTVHLGPFYIETVPPTDPTGVNSTSHSLSTWSANNTVTVIWTDATDATSGLDGYSILWDTSANTTPSANKNAEEGVQIAIGAFLADGNSHYVHIRSKDNAGNWQSTVHLGPFYIDTTSPTDPTSVNSTIHTTSVWSSDNTVDITWTDATDNLSGLDGYSILWDTSANTTPSANKTIEDGVQTTTSAELADGNSHYFHIRSVDNVGNWQSTAHTGPFYIAVYSPFLSDGGVSPGSGYASTNFTYSVNYTDFENEGPSSITVTIDGGAASNMTVRTGQDGVFTTGEIYEYSVFGSSLGLGSHTFQFAANDGTDDAIGDVDSHSGPTVSSPPSGGGNGGGGGGGGGGATDDSRITAFGDFIKESGEVWDNIVALSLDNKLSLDIPIGTFAKNRADAALYSLKVMTLAEPPEVPENMAAVGSVYELLPDGVKFDPPIPLTIQYDVSEIPEGVSESNLYIAKWIESSQEWIELESTVDPTTQTVSTRISGFSIHTVMASTLLASFTLTDLTINPEIIEVGDSIDISVTLANTGNLSGSYEVSLMIDDVLEQVQEVTLDIGESEQVSFIITPDTIGEHTINVCGLLGTCKVEKPKAPAVFRASDLAISPVELLTGGRVTISLTLTNTGGRSGTHDVSLKIDGVQIETRSIELDGEESQKVVFAVIPDTAGTYSVDVDGLSGSFVVKEIAPASVKEEKMTAPAPAITPTLEPSPAPEEVPKPLINQWTIVGIIVGIAIAGLASYYFIRKKRKMV